MHGKQLSMNIIRFLKNWTLPAAMVTGTVVYLIFAYVPFLESAAIFFDPILDYIFPWFMFLILFVTFCKIDFRKMRPRKWHMWVSLFQIVVSFLFVWVIVHHRMEGNSRIFIESLLTCVIGPGAAAAAIVTDKLGGNLTSMTTFTFISNFVTALLVPICFPLIDPDISMGFWASFLLILYKVCSILVLPMILAYIVKHYMKRFHQFILSVPDLSYYLWACSLTIVTGTTVKHICHAGTTAGFLMLIAVSSLVLCIIQFVVGRGIGSHYDSVIDAGQALGQKNTAFAIWIAYTYLNPLSSVGPGCYILWQNIVNSIELWEKRKRDEKLSK